MASCLDNLNLVPDEEQSEVFLLFILLPPPVSLDVLCAITGLPPVGMLQIIEGFVQSSYLSKYTEKGAGYYYLTDFKGAKQRLNDVPRQLLGTIALKAVAGICKHLPDSIERWLILANIYQVSQIPLKHCRELVKAGHHCLQLNLPVDAAQYYRMALEAMEKRELEAEEQENFIDATIGLCTCRDSSLFKDVQTRYLDLSLSYSHFLNDPKRRVKIALLIAKGFFRTVRNSEAARYLEQANRLLEEHDFSSGLRLHVALTNSEFYFWQGQITKAIKCYESAIGNHEELPDDLDTLKSCVQLGHTYGVHGEVARGAGLVRAVLKKAYELSALDLQRYAKLVLVMIFSDAGRNEEGELYLNQIFETPDEMLDHYTLWPGYGKRAYFAFCRGDYENALKYQDLAWMHSKALGSPHHRGADNIEVMLGLEERGMIHPEWNFKFDIDRLLNWPDIYMQGVARRFLAQKDFKRKASLEKVKAELDKSIDLLQQAGAKVELAHAQVLMARVCFKQGKGPKAEKLLKNAWDVFSKVNPKLFPEDLKPFLDRTSKNALWVESLLEVGDFLGSVRNRDELLANIIRQAMRIAGAERGAIFFQSGQELEAVASRNLDISEIAEGLSGQLRLVREVFRSGKEIVGMASRHSDQDAGGDVTGSGVVSCFPIALKSRVYGVIFLDRGPTRLQLPGDEISLLRIVSNQAAVALENMQAYEEIVDLNNELEAETHYYRENMELNLHRGQMVGKSEPFKRMLRLIDQVADSDTTVMIIGETGVGKELVAQAIHQHSKRALRAFIAVNVASLSPDLIASELFGHEKGAFTGATQVRQGRFELANRGTLFLDDVDALSLEIQAKMLRVLETREFERAGGARTIQTNFRLVAASNRNIDELVERGLFRSDFYFRLNVFPIRVPPLRERREDIPLLAYHFMKIFEGKFGKQFGNISRQNMDIMMNYHWPGNVRELRHVMERAVLLSRNKQLIIPALNANLPSSSSPEEKILPLREMEIRHILKALNRCHGKVSGKGGAAELLELKPTTLYSKMQRLGIERSFKQHAKEGR